MLCLLMTAAFLCLDKIITAMYVFERAWVPIFSLSRYLFFLDFHDHISVPPFSEANCRR